MKIKIILIAIIVLMMIQSAMAINTTVIVVAAPTSPPSSSSSSGGSSGGGGVVSDECFSNVARKETRENDLRFGAYVPFYFTSDIPVYEVQVKGLKNEPDVSIRVESLVDMSCKLTAKPQADIYRYLNIFSGVKQDGVKIAFKVSNSWISGGTVLLTRWQNGVWNDLPTTQIKKDDRYTYFEAESGGFSQFAIIEKAIPKPEVAVPQVTVTAAQVQPTAAIVIEKTEPEGEPSQMGLVLVILAVLILSGATAYLIYKRCKK